MIPPNDKYIDECMKIYKRFIKEKGKYTYMMKFLFGYKRGKKEFYESVKLIYDKYNKTFGDILHMVPTLGPVFNRINWYRDIKPISDEFERYFKAHKHNIKV